MIHVPTNIRRFVLRGAACLLLATALGTGLGACRPSPPQGLGNCFEALPLAEGSLNAPKSSYEFHGVKMVKPAVLAELVRERFPTNPSASYNPPKYGSTVCAFAFTGDFPAGQVAGAPPTATGKAAIVLVSTRLKLLFSFVLAKLPERFDRPFTGA
jgi:hypothetical protein